MHSKGRRSTLTTILTVFANSAVQVIFALPLNTILSPCLSPKWNFLCCILIHSQIHNLYLLHLALIVKKKYTSLLQKQISLSPTHTHTHTHILSFLLQMLLFVLCVQIVLSLCFIHKQINSVLTNCSQGQPNKNRIHQFRGKDKTLWAFQFL